MAEAATRGAGLDWKTSLQELDRRPRARRPGATSSPRRGPGPRRRRSPPRSCCAGAACYGEGAGRSKKAGRAGGRRGARWRALLGRRDRPRRLTPMPELPEVEVVRRGLERVGRRPHHRRGRGAPPAGRPPAPRRRRRLRRRAGRPHAHRRAAGAASTSGCRWRRRRTPLDGWSPPRHERPAARRSRPTAPDETHLRVRFTFTDGGRELRFVDQRTFGGLAVGRAAGAELPGRDRAHRPRPARPARSTTTAFVAALRAPAHRGQAGAARPDADLRRRQHLRRRGAVAGPAARRAAHRRAAPGPRRAGCSGTSATCCGEALAQGGTCSTRCTSTSTAQSGYFDRVARRLRPRGRARAPAAGRRSAREPFMNRSSYSCPRCQPRPRARPR